MNLQNIIAHAGMITKIIAVGKKMISELRETVVQEHPGDLAAFDAAVAEARKPWQDASDAATADEGTGDD